MDTSSSAVKEPYRFDEEIAGVAHGDAFGDLIAFTAPFAVAATNLAVVAPGIAEALLATAIGLVAAIPAVVIYNLQRPGAYELPAAPAVREVAQHD